MNYKNNRVYETRDSSVAIVIQNCPLFVYKCNYNIYVEGEIQYETDKVRGI